MGEPGSKRAYVKYYGNLHYTILSTFILGLCSIHRVKPRVGLMLRLILLVAKPTTYQTLLPSFIVPKIKIEFNQSIL